MASYLVSMDPGLRTCGIAIFKNSILWRSGLARNSEPRLRGPGAWKTMAAAVEELVAQWTEGVTMSEEDNWEFVSEIPQIYSYRGLLKVDPADLLELAGVVGTVCALFSGRACGYLPKDWKKSVPKDIHNKWIVKRLNVQEQEILWKATNSIPSLHHNAIDAVGIGLFHLARLRIGLKGKDLNIPEEVYDWEHDGGR